MGTMEKQGHLLSYPLKGKEEEREGRGRRGEVIGPYP